MEIRKINFSDILPIWENNLWPGRKSPIKPVSTIQFMGSYDMSLKKSKPTFLELLLMIRLRELSVVLKPVRKCIGVVGFMFLRNFVEEVIPKSYFYHVKLRLWRKDLFPCGVCPKKR